MSEDFTKTDIYGFFKPAHGAPNWGHLTDVNWDMVDRLLARQAEMMQVMKREIALLRDRIAVLEPEAPEDND